MGHNGMDDNNCVCDVVNFINDLQDAAEDNDGCPTNCLNPVLGANNNHHHHHNANTRPFILYLENGCPFEAAFKKDTITDCEHAFDVSKFLRVENVENCCALIRVLKCFEENGNLRFRATDSCITVDLSCFCAIQCLEDTHVSGL